jgi:hypothetical protein
MTNEKYKEVCDSISQEDIDIVLNLCSDKLKQHINELLTEKNPLNIPKIIVSFIQMIIGEIYIIKDDLDDEQSKKKWMGKTKEIYRRTTYYNLTKSAKNKN